MFVNSCHSRISLFCHHSPFCFITIHHQFRLPYHAFLIYECFIFVKRFHFSFLLWYLSRLVTKPTKWSLHQAKTQISLGICPVGSESSLCTKLIVKDPSFLLADSEDTDQTGRMPRLIYSDQTGWMPRPWSDWVDAQADLSLRWAHMPFPWFCHEAAHLSLSVRLYASYLHT